ncbi:hypothetical protein WAX74_19930 [Psychrobacillus sp. FJAT-51614]|uniref:Fructose-bisphosphate aldolase n=1 Tax=Psychrobacillus mangrovi TaxID=3117745 RepID=A0ABU8FA63_9BACI
MKRILFLLIGLCYILTACNNTDPDIQVNTIISNVTAEEFNGLGRTNEYGESNQKDFKKLAFDFSMEHGDGVKRKIEMFNDWRTLLKEYDGLERYWGGDSTSQDNIEENFAKYHYELIFYSKGLSEAEVKKIFKEARIHIEWEADEETQTKDYFIGDNINFKD